MITQTKAETLTLSQLISKFLERRPLAGTTRQFYTHILSKVEWYARSQGWPTDPNLITRSHLRDLINYTATEKFRWPEAQRPTYKLAAPATVHHYGVAIKALFNWAEDEEYIERSPAQKLKLAPALYKEVEPYSDQEVQAFLQLCEDDARFWYRYLGIRNKALISLFVDTGLRLTELAKIRLSDLDPKLRQVRVMGKGAKARVVPINGEARKALRRYLEIRPRRGSDELWKTSDGRELAPRGIQILIKRLKRRAGIKGGGGTHRFRHYFATRYLEAGGDLNTLRLLLGHSTLAMVLKYSKCVDIQKALAGHEQFSPLDRLYQGGNHNRGDDGWGWKY